jgi:hypothetical protein
VRTSPKSPVQMPRKFGRMDVSEARRGQGLEIDHKEIARRKTQALVTVKTDYYLATPSILKPLDSGPWVTSSCGSPITRAGSCATMADTAGMAILRTDIIRALDELIKNEAGTSFQALAVVLAKQKWTDLIASEWHNDGGLDAYAPASLAEGKKAKGVRRPLPERSARSRMTPNGRRKTTRISKS